MSNEERPNAPKPKPPPKGIAQGNPGGKRVRFQELLEKNWQSSDPRFWKFKPDHRFRFRAPELQEMEELVTPKEREVFLATYDHFGLKMRAAHLLGFPYALGDWLIVQRERERREDERWEAIESENLEIHDLACELDAEDLIWDRL